MLGGDSDLGRNDVVGDIPDSLPKIRGVGEGHALDFGDDSTLQGGVDVLVTLLYQEHPSVGRDRYVSISHTAAFRELPQARGRVRVTATLT